MNQIQALSRDRDKNYNQLTRWIMNKEDHANKFTEIVTQCFMTQRIEPAEQSDGKAYEDYVNKLTRLHHMMVTAMKCKQTTDLDHVESLRTTLTKFKHAYLGKDIATESHHDHGQAHSH